MRSSPAPAPHDRTLAGLQGSQSSRRLQEIVDRAVQKAIGEFAADSLDTAQIAVTLADVSRPRIDWASARGQVKTIREFHLSPGVEPAFVFRAAPASGRKS